MTGDASGVGLAVRCPRRILPRTFLRAAIFGCLAIAAAVGLPESARAWGCEGHEVVALIAEKRLNPRALAAVNRILKEAPIDPSLARFCKGGRVDAMSDASTWADDFRTTHPETAPWHYINIPLADKKRDIEKYCDPQAGCV
ncbi:MAG: S1/P1 nuclease, partial [Candidatus Acidiferrales bacterium]